MGFFFGTILTVLAVFLILLVLVQRGRGGGLTGALGGMGGSSAFGAKAGDVFTRITIVTASIWIIFCAASVYWANNLRGDRLGAGAVPLSPLSQSTLAEPPLNTPAPTQEGKSTTTNQAAPADESTSAPSKP